ncbi:response regulator transcription factor [Streptomyces radiopugnans]|nr:response regulator transcription factor [Streptomyces radiopugnans]
MLTAPDREAVRRASRLAADGFLLETGLNAGTLGHAVEAVARGEIPVPPSLVRELLSEVKTGGRCERGPQLTPREEAALALLVQGMSNKQIARRLGISEHGAKRHVSNVLAKLNCPNRTVAAVVAVQDGLIAAPAH